MLGENHSLLSEFPEYKETILNLVSNDSGFAEKTKEYDQLDADIRKLELADSPIDDLQMQTLKKSRAKLKDELFNTLKKS